jgi:hypothetical protein
MPRDGSSIYHRPPGTDGIPNTTIASTPYNSYVADVEQDLNLPRPIVAGGTGANNARDAMTSLQGDVAYQVVTNYDAYAFVSGSFYSAAGATSAPTANAFIGQCYTSDPAVVPPAVPAGQNMFIEARDVTTGLKYLRQKTAGVWGAWAQQAGSTAALDAAYVNVAGDTMTGPLGISYANPAIAFTKAAGNSASLTSYVGTNGRWMLSLGDNAAEGGSNAGSNFTLGAYSDVGGLLSTPLTITRSNGNAAFSNAVTAGNDITVGSNGTTGTYYFGNTGTKSLNYNGTVYNLAGGNLSITQGALLTNGATLQFGGAAATGYFSDGTNVIIRGYAGASTIFLQNANGAATYATFTAASAVLSGTLSVGGQLSATGHQCRNGISGGYIVDQFNLYWSNPTMFLFHDNTNMGGLTISSDYRIKKDVIDLPGMWDTVKALRPIKYTQAEFSPPSHLALQEQNRAEGKEVSGSMFTADNIERWGFIAHELQATLVESASTGVKDQPDLIQSPNPFTVIAALTKALQEAMARIEALEAA